GEKKGAGWRPFGRVPRGGTRAAENRLHFCSRIHFTRVSASASETCGFAGIGIGPQTPVLPLRTCSDSVATAFESFAYLAATSLYAGPISFLSTAWQAVQFLAFASSRLAMAVPEAQ